VRETSEAPPTHEPTRADEARRGEARQKDDGLVRS